MQPVCAAGEHADSCTPSALHQLLHVPLRTSGRQGRHQCLVHAPPCRIAAGAQAAE